MLKLPDLLAAPRDTIMVIDTETTDKWRFDLPSEADEQPHMVQLAFSMYHKEQLVYSQSVLTNECFESNMEALQLHGITARMQADFGVHMDAALLTLCDMLTKCQLVVAHSAIFDLKVVRQSLRRAGLETLCDTIGAMPTFCTMTGNPYVKEVRGKGGWLSLQEAYQLFVDPTGFRRGHNAMADVQACAELYFALLKWPARHGITPSPVSMGDIANA